MSDGSSSERGARSPLKALYVRVLLRLLPLLLSIARHPSRKIRAEAEYLNCGYTFMLSVDGTNLSCVCMRTKKGSFKRISRPHRTRRRARQRLGKLGRKRRYRRLRHSVPLACLCVFLLLGRHVAEKRSCRARVLDARP